MSAPKHQSSPYYVYLELEGNIEDDHRLVLQVSYCVDLTFEGYSSLKLQRLIKYHPHIWEFFFVTLDHILMLHVKFSKIYPNWTGLLAMNWLSDKVTYWVTYGPAKKNLQEPYFAKYLIHKLFASCRTKLEVGLFADIEKWVSVSKPLKRRKTNVSFSFHIVSDK